MDLKKLTPHAIAVFALLAISCLFFAPNVFSGKVLSQPDNEKARAMQTEIMEYQKKGEQVLWTNSAFGGMPAYQIYAKPSFNPTGALASAFVLGRGISSVWAFVFCAMFCMYFFLVCLKMDWRVAVFGALAYGITSYNVDIIEAGHSTKMSALAFAPGMLAGVSLLMGGRFLLGGSVFALFTAFQVNANHVQITYYTFLIVGIYFLIEMIWAIRHQGMANWGIRVGALILATFLGVASNLVRIWPTWEYGQETIRGASELTQRASKGDGLDKDYLFGWSYGIGETATLLVPHAYGGGQGEKIATGEFYKMVSRGAGPGNQAQIARQVGSMMYFGDQPFVGTAIYFGAIVCFLFVLGAFLVRGPEKWWLLASGLFMISLAWGKNFFLNDIFYDFMPMFKKFRAVTMAFGLAQLCFAALAAFGLQKLFDEDISKEKKLKALYWAGGITAGVCLFVMMMGGGEGQNDAEIAAQVKIPNLSDILQKDRAALARSDAFRSLGFVAVAFGLLWLSVRGSLKAGLAVLAVAAISLIDNWLVCGRTLSSEKYTDAKSTTAIPPMTPADKQIKADPDPHFRVLDLSRGGPTSNWETSFYHKSLGGYHAAKLQRYQEVIDSFMNQNLGDNLHILGMFNGKYLVTQKGEVIQNPKACGAAWFVKDYKLVNSANEEFSALHTLDPMNSAVLQSQYAFQLGDLKIQYDSTNSIKLTNYHPDKMEYTYSCKTEQLAVFPEIYYPPTKGWKCYLDGKEMDLPFTKVNYLLRGLKLPPGENRKFEMRFEPKSWAMGEKMSIAAALITIGIFLFGFFKWFKNHELHPAGNLVDNEPSAPVEKPKKAAVEPGKKAEAKKKK